MPVPHLHLEHGISRVLGVIGDALDDAGEGVHRRHGSGLQAEGKEGIRSANGCLLPRMHPRPRLRGASCITMKSVFIHRDPVLVGHALSLLTEVGIPAFVRNEASHNLMGASIVGTLMAFDPDLCVINDADWERAVELLKTSLIIRRPATSDTSCDWSCPACGQQVPEGFDQCWACETTRGSSESTTRVRDEA
jgi:hypothetical protein